MKLNDQIMKLAAALSLSMALLLAFTSCGNKQNNTGTQVPFPTASQSVADSKADPAAPQPLVLGVWQLAEKGITESRAQEWMEPLYDAGITDFYISGTVEQVTAYVQAAKAYDGARVHAWIQTMNGSQDPATFSHPDWFEVNRLGQNSLNDPPYVKDYKWLSPAVPAVRNFVKAKAARYARIPGISSVHLDFIRFNDAFLGRYSQEHYFHIQQDSYEAKYDFGYHPMAIAAFKKEFGYSPLDLSSPWMSPEWLQFRLNEITSLVNEIVDTVHSIGPLVSAAVFPFPTRARMMVYQDWPTWKVDILCPMNYQTYYKEGFNWIKFSVENGLRETFHHNTYISGVAVHNQSATDLYQAAKISAEAGADGVNFFSAPALLKSPEKLKAVERFHHDYPNRIPNDGRK